MPDRPPDPHLRTDHLRADLKGRAVRSAAVTITSEALRFVLTLGTTVVLARLLLPEDFGLVAMVAAAIGFAGLFKDLGLSTATIQREGLTQAQVSTLFWVNLLMGALLTVGVAAAAPLVAWFYGDPRLVAITLALSLTYVLGSGAVQHRALLQRQMRFKALAVVTLGAQAVGAAVGIGGAVAGWGFWALVAMPLAREGSYLVALWIASGWRPGRPERGAGTRPLLRFGSHLTGFNLLNYLARNLDNILIGKVAGTAALGFYQKAYSLLMLPLRQVNRPLRAVALPVLSRLVHTPEAYRQAYLRTLAQIALVTMPLIAFMVATADWLVRLVLGPQWAEAAPLFALLGAAALVQPVTNTTGWLFLSQNRTADMLRWGLLGEGLAVAAIVVGLRWGAVGVAAAYALVSLFLRTPLLFWWVGRRGPVGAADFYRTVAPFALVALLVGAGVYGFRLWAAPVSYLTGLAGALPVATGLTALGLMALPAGRRTVASLRRLGLHLTPRP